MQGGWLRGRLALARMPSCTQRRTGQRSSGKLNLPMHLFLVIRRIFLLCAPSNSPPPPPTLLSLFFTRQQLRLPRLPFRPSLRSRNLFTASIDCFQFLFFAIRKAELLRAVEEGEGKRAPPGGCRGEGGHKKKGAERRKERRDGRDCAPRGAHFSLGKRNARAASKKAGSAEGATKASDNETPKDERSEPCHGA